MYAGESDWYVYVYAHVHIDFVYIYIYTQVNCPCLNSVAESRFHLIQSSENMCIYICIYTYI